MAGVQNGTSQWPREVAFQGRGGQLCLMRPSQVEEEEGWDQAIKFNDLGDSFSWVMGQMPGWRGLGDKLVVGLVKGRREIRDSFKQKPGQGKEFWGKSVVRRRLKIKKGLMTYIMRSTWMRWFSFSAWFWWALPELSWQVRKQGGRGSNFFSYPFQVFFFFYLYWGIIEKAIIYLTYSVMIWYSILCERIPTTHLMNTSITSRVYLFIFVRLLKINCLSKFQLYSTVLSTIVSMLYISSSEFIHMIIHLTSFRCWCW